METNFTQKNPKKFYCEKCDFNCSNKKDYNRHLLTRKHKMEMNGNDFLPQKTPLYACNECNTAFKTNSGLWKHQQKCAIIQDKEQSNNIAISETYFDKELLIKMLLKNQDVMEKMVEMIPNMGTNNSHNTNSHNTNNFNIQMFLNDHCKHAMNLTDFIHSLPITSATYDSTIENGLTKTITNMMVNGLNDLDILERPIHCTDASRKTLYVKDSDKWEKDNEMLHIMKGIKELSLKQRTMISKWKEANEGWDKDDKLQSKMTNLVFNSMTQIEVDNKETSKIIKSISKNVYLDNDTKHNYTK